MTLPCNYVYTQLPSSVSGYHTTLSSTMTLLPVPTQSGDVALSSTMILLPVPTQTSPVPTQSSGKTLSLYISVGVSGVVVVLIAAAVIVISVTVCLKKRKSKHVNTLTDNVAYGVSEKDMEISTNAAYNATFNSTNLQDKADTYDYVATTDINITTLPNEAYVTIPVSINQAYEMLQH